MPKSIWNGTISFGLAHVPIKLYSATGSKTVRFHEVHLSDGAPIVHRRICSKEGKEVPYKDVVKGFEVSADEYVVLGKDELKAAAGSRGKVVEIEEFVPEDAIDPVFFDKTYYVDCRDDGEAYRVFHEALKQTGRVGIGRFTFHDREYLAAVRSLDGCSRCTRCASTTRSDQGVPRAGGPRDGLLSLPTMLFHDEVRPTNGIAPGGRKPAKGRSSRRWR
jgi:DNA end-binding protein Ku